ncbi:MAG: winged helix-turn-helix transcriptional regulator [Bdellovibrionaceae bacterium]|nr:winged helix-turn-helix transcriptional regulator [Pseudobdellovibrionaceae bacterium]
MTNNIKVLEQYGTLRRNLMLQVSGKIKDLPFGHRQMVMLRVINRTNDISLGKLAETVGTDPGTVSRSIAQMIELGWVEKEQSRNDGRLWTVRMTAKGLKQMPNIDEIYGSVADMMMGGLEDVEREQFFSLLSKINGTFGEKPAQ